MGRGLQGGQLIDGGNVMCRAYGDFRQQALLALLRVKNESIIVHNSPIRDSTGTRKASLSSQSLLIQFGLEVAGDDKVRLWFFAVLRDADRY